jgi:ABC-type multidrug transport system permease subunit
MRHVLVIAWYDIRRVLGERESLFWLFVGPLIFTVFFGLLFRPGAPARPTLRVVNQDATDQVLRAVTPWLERDGVTVIPVPAVVKDRVTLVIPAGAGAAVQASRGVTYTLHAGADESAAERNTRFKIQKALTRLYLGQSAPADAAASVSEGPIFIREGEIGVARREQTTGFQRSVPAYLVMFVFLNLLVSGAGIAEDRASGRLRRIAMAPVSRQEIVLGKLLGRFAIGWIQIVYMLGFGLIVGIRWADHGWLFFGFLSLFALSSASLGILLGTLFKDPDKCASIAVWTAILLAPLGGLWWPLEIVSPGMRQLAYAVPTGWAMEGVNAMLAFGAGWTDVAPFALGFLGLFAVSFPLAARRLRV